MICVIILLHNCAVGCRFLLDGNNKNLLKTGEIHRSLADRYRGKTAMEKLVFVCTDDYVTK